MTAFYFFLTIINMVTYCPGCTSAEKKKENEEIHNLFKAWSAFNNGGLVLPVQNHSRKKLNSEKHYLNQAALIFFGPPMAWKVMQYPHSDNVEDTTYDSTLYGGFQFLKRCLRPFPLPTSNMIFYLLCRWS